MTTFDYLLLVLAAVVLLYQLRMLLRERKNVVIHGVTPNKKPIMIVFAIIVLIAMLRAQNLAQQWPVFVLIVAICSVVFCTGCGLGTDGIYSGGKFIDYKKAMYYDFDTRSKEGLTCRMSTLTKECAMRIQPEQQAEILKLMAENGIPDFEAYQKKVQKSVKTRQEAQQRKKKKK